MLVGGWQSLDGRSRLIWMVREWARLLSRSDAGVIMPTTGQKKMMLSTSENWILLRRNTMPVMLVSGFCSRKSSGATMLFSGATGWGNGECTIARTIVLRALIRLNLMKMAMICMIFLFIGTHLAPLRGELPVHSNTKRASNKQDNLELMKRSRRPSAARNVPVAKRSVMWW
jgi:hypothetical protein